MSLRPSAQHDAGRHTDNDNDIIKSTTSPYWDRLRGKRNLPGPDLYNGGCRY